VDKCRHAHGCREHTGGGTMSEPMWLHGDDVALGIEPICDKCDNRHDEDDGCDSGEPDEMWDSIFED